MRRSTDLLVGVCLAVVATGSIVALPEGNVIRAVLGLLLVLIFPGYMLTAFFFPIATLALTTRVVYVFGSSIAVCALGGLLLNLIPTGMTQTSWLLYLNIIVWGAGVGGLFRRSLNPREAAVRPVGLQLRFSQIAFVSVLVIFVVVGTIGIARNGVLQQPTTRFTQLWMQPSASQTLTVGIVNEEQETMYYRLVLTDPQGAPVKSTDIALDSGQTWTQAISLPTQGTSQGVFTALLYRLDSPAQIYRRVTYELTAPKSSSLP